MEFRIGKTSFNADSLKGLSNKEAKERFSNVHPEILKQAIAKANPKRKTNAKKEDDK